MGNPLFDRKRRPCLGHQWALHGRERLILWILHEYSTHETEVESLQVHVHTSNFLMNYYWENLFVAVLLEYKFIVCDSNNCEFVLMNACDRIFAPQYLLTYGNTRGT